MSHEPHDETAFLRAARAELVSACENLDDGTRSRLRGIRQEALRCVESRRHALLAPFGALATVCVLVLSVAVLDRRPVPQGAESALPVEDLEILSSGELELYEDFEFYQWLAENDEE